MLIPVIIKPIIKLSANTIEESEQQIDNMPLAIVVRSLRLLGRKQGCFSPKLPLGMEVHWVDKFLFLKLITYLGMVVICMWFTTCWDGHLMVYHMNWGILSCLGCMYIPRVF